MAAALGHVARRLGAGGALRQTQAAAFSPAVEAQQQRFCPRLIHTERASELPGKEAGAMKNIRKKTEELHELGGLNSKAPSHDLLGRHINRSHGDFLTRRPSGATAAIVLFMGYLGAWYVGVRYVFESMELQRRTPVVCPENP